MLDISETVACSFTYSVKVGGSISSEDLLASRSAGVHGEVLAVTDEMV